MQHDLLVTPIITWRTPERHRLQATLPGILSRLAAGELEDFPRLRTHQLHPWCMLLTQLAAIALQRAGQSDPRLPEDDWFRLLLALTDGRHEPWSLVVDELSEPAFLQPPIPEGTLDGWKIHAAPDDIDILVTAKAHDVKASLIPDDDVEAWLYALVTLQTMQGYPGRGYTGIARMKGGYGNRPRLGLAADYGLSSRFLRDIRVLQDTWPALTARDFNDHGVALVWTEPWDGRTSLPLHKLAPHFIEVCWRVRFASSATRLRCYYTTTERRRCAPEIDTGDVGDAWAPIERGSRGMLTVGGRGFHYDLLRRLLFENDFEPAAAQSLRPDDPDLVLLLASALARGQGRTEGLHDRVLTLSRSVRRQLAQSDARLLLGQRAEERVADADRMHRKILYPALRELRTAGPDEFDRRVDDMFFLSLFASIAEDDESARLSWQRQLCHVAETELQQAITRCALPSARRYKLVSAASGMFVGCLRKTFPDIAMSPPITEGVYA